MIDVAVPIDPAEIAGEIEPTELNRLLGMPRGRELEGELRDRAAWARDWYARHGKPYLTARRHEVAAVATDGVTLENGLSFASRALAEHLRRWEAHAMVGLAASAGVAVDLASDQAWKEGRPDEGYFLERFGVAVVERLVQTATLRLCRAAEETDATLTPHLSPGCGAWELEHQRILWQAIFPGDELGPIRLLESGGLAPKNSILAAAGVTRRQVALSPLDACRACDLARCKFRRTPYVGAP
jgi:hypothetical protein